MTKNLLHLHLVELSLLVVKTTTAKEKLEARVRRVHIFNKMIRERLKTVPVVDVQLQLDLQGTTI